MNKKNLLVAVGIVAACAVIFIVIYALGHVAPSTVPAPSGVSTSTEATATTTGQGSSTAGDPEQQIRAMVTSFGAVFKNVDLYAPTSTADAQIQQNLAPFVSSDILSTWEADPIKAPGRKTAGGPWPDHVEIVAFQGDPDGSYDVQASVIEVTSAAQAASGGQADHYSIFLKVRSQNAKWIITGFVKAIPLAGSNNQ